MQESKKRVLAILFFCVLAGIGYGFARHFAHYNRIVLERFEGRLWELPARVYARPLEIYPGMEVNPAALMQELKFTQYLQVTRPVEVDMPGKFLCTGDTFHLYCRAFEFEDGESPSRKIQIVIRKGKIDFLQDSDTKDFPDTIRLDPALIGSFYPSHKEDRILVTLKALPHLLAETLLAVEDRRFYDHYGVQPMAIIRALIANLRKHQVVQGASTITQQLAKNFFLSNERSLKRKISELFMALALEWNYTKDEILEAYMNEVYFGQDGERAVHGFGLASSFFFGKSVEDLHAHEVALLVGLLKGPSYYDPRKNPENALKRRNTVIQVMSDMNLIRIEEAKRAMESPLGVIADPPKGATQFPAYLDMVKRQLLEEYREEDLRSAGLRIFTAFDPQAQAAAEKAVTGQVSQIEQSHRLPKGKLEVSAAVTSTGGNELLALIGGRDFRFKGFNRALDAKRPIGSLIKPAVFLTALSRPERYSLISRLNDSYLSLPDEKGKTWTPQNYDRQYHGNVPLYVALANSYNVATVRLGMEIGLSDVFETLREMGFTREPSLYPSALLGTVEMSPIEAAQMYQTLASGGFYSPIRAIRAVCKPDGASLQRYALTVRQNLDPGPVYLLNRILQAVVTEGTARSLKNVLPETLGIAGKTGTTNDLKDSWFVGFSGNYLAAVWMGRDDNQPCGLTGASGALQVWGSMMAGIPNTPLELPLPENVEWAVIDAKSGKRTDEVCENAMAIPFIRGSAPTETVSCPKAEQKAVEAKQIEEKKKAAEPRVIRWLREVFNQ